MGFAPGIQPIMDCKDLEAKLGFALQMGFLFPKQCILTFIYMVLSPQQVCDDLEVTQA